MTVKIIFLNFTRCIKGKTARNYNDIHLNLHPPMQECVVYFASKNRFFLMQLIRKLPAWNSRLYLTNKSLKMCKRFLYIHILTGEEVIIKRKSFKRQRRAEAERIILFFS